MDVSLIPGHNPGPYTGAGNNTYLIRGREPALVDAATAQPRHLVGVREALTGRPLRRVLVTHGHSDHASGSRALQDAWPSAEFCKMPWPERDESFGVAWHPLRHDDRVAAGDSTLRVVHTPGHAPDHVCFLDEDSGTLFAGDLVIQGGTVVVPASSGGSLVSYLQSLEVVRDLRPTRVLPAHGPEITDLSALVDEYLSHRRRREEEILAVLKGVARTRDALVELIYTGLPASLKPPAGESVLAHLVKLRDEGRVQERDGVWSLVSPVR